VKPLRVAMYVPGHKERLLAKAVASGADAVIFDLEDSVPIAAKAEGRLMVARAIDSATSSPVALLVRVNASSSGLLADDLAHVVRSGLNAILLPKVERVEEVRAASVELERREYEAGLEPGSVQIILQIESALGVYRCFELIQASDRVVSVSFGSARDGDLQRDLGCGWSLEGTELLYARSKVLLDARAAGVLYPLDGVFSDLADEEALFKDSKLSARLGYIGRTAIHPKQIAPIRQAYAVPADEIAYYRSVISEFEAGEKAGSAAITVDGKLVDYAMYERAKRVLALSRLDG
jgi:citrate lyase subunit beta / citryl-CoA lyase